MWDYFRSRLIEMPQVFLGVDLIQAFNPLYALPIVAVILGAFLVYAFGFKAPVQPPSFDEIEIDKKSSKRRRVKENQKNKSQTGKVNSSVAKPTDNLISEKKKKSNKTVGERISPKDETKATKKAALVNDKKKLNASQEQSLMVEDLNDEGWVHLVSKKGRKGRKKDDVSPNTDVVQLTVIPTEMALDICDKPLENRTATNALDENSETNKSSVNDVKIQQKTLLKEDQASIKVNLKKQKSKKKDKENIEVSLNLSNNLDHEKKNELKSPVMADVNVVPDVEINAGMKVSKEKKPSKKKKKKYETDEKENIQMLETRSPDMSYSFHASDAKNTAGLPTVSSERKSGRVPEVESIPDGKIETDKPDQPIEANGTNVAFDELEGLYPDPKPVKKKKKVRRDH